jgi:protein NEDD1
VSRAVTCSSRALLQTNMLAISTTSSLALLPASSLKHPPKSVKQTYTFPSASPPTAIAWSSDNASLFATSTSSLTHFTASGDLTAVIPVHDGAENLLIKDKSALLFSITGTSKIHIRSVSNPEKTAQVIDTHKAPKVITSLALSNDGSLLVSTCATGVHVHNLTLNSHTVLRGIPAGVITTSAFHPHARTRLLLGIGAQLVVYDTTRLSGPSKVISISVDGGTPGHVVDIACSPFSKTLVGVGMSGGWVGLVDLDKEKALFRVLPTYAPLTALVFTPNGASLAAGTENGKVMLIDLRALDRPAATFCIGEGAGNGDRIVGIAVQVHASISLCRDGI